MVKKWILEEFIKKNFTKYIGGFAALIIATLLSISIPKLLGFIIDSLENKSQTLDQIYFYALMLLVMAVGLFIMKYIFRSLLIGRSRDLECFLRSKLFTHLQTLTPEFYNERKTGDLMSYAINDLNAIRMSFSFGIVFLVEGFLINFFSIIVMAQTINPLLTLIAVVPIAASVFFIIKLRKIIRKKFIKVQQAFADLSDKIQENISGIRVVKAYVQEAPEIEKLEKISRKRLDIHMDYVKTSALLSPFTQICFGISFAVVLVIGGYYVVDGKISLGDFIAFNTYLAMLVRPITQIGRLVEIWQRSFASIKRLDDIFNIKPVIAKNDGDIRLNNLKGSLEIKNLTFNYPKTEKNVLQNINISLKSGQTLGIIGKTGSGKTTLINLLLRLYDIPNGKIFLNGVDIKKLHLETIRENIAYVPQDNFLFATSIKENIKFFNEGFDDEEVYSSAKRACIYDDIESFPDKFETIIGERGITLSGGQKQRVSIARAFIKNSAFLILDDSLSAVDTKTEEQILTNINEIVKDRTAILIAHRISTLKNADEIIVMDNGRIAERGNHESLLALKGEYYRLNKIQSMEEALEE